jgi:hypothetical protein
MATCKTILPKFISMENNLTATIIIYYIWMDQINGTQYMYKTKLVIPSTQTDILTQHKLFLCGYAVLNRTVWYIINLLMPFKTFSTVQWSSIYDWLIATAMHVPQIFCVCYSIVNIAKCKQQVTEFLLHMITIKFWKFDEYGDWLSSDCLLNIWLPAV